MTKFRRRLLMSVAAGVEPATRTDLVTWEKLFSVIDKGVFIRNINGEYKIFKDYNACSGFITWAELYQVIEPEIYFTIENNQIKTNYDISNGKPHPQAFVSIGELRKIFPYGFKVSNVNGAVELEYDESLVSNDDDPNRFATPIDLFKIIPHGIEFFLIGGELIIRNLGLNKEHAVDLEDLSQCDELPNIYHNAPLDSCPSLRDLFEIIPSGVTINSDSQLVYNNALDYCDTTPVTYREFMSIVYNNFRLVKDQYNNISAEPYNFEVDSATLDTPITWGVIRSIIPDGVTVSQMSSGEYYFRYSKSSVWADSLSTNTVTRRELSKIIPYGLYVSLLEDGELSFMENLDHIIWYDRFDNPFTESVLDSILNGHTVNVDDYTGTAYIE